MEVTFIKFKLSLSKGPDGHSEGQDVGFAFKLLIMLLGETETCMAPVPGMRRLEWRHTSSSVVAQRMEDYYPGKIKMDFLDEVTFL